MERTGPRPRGRRAATYGRPALAAVATALAGVLALELVAVAVPAGWSGPTRVFSAPIAPRHAMVVDGAGRTHIAAEDGSSGIMYISNVSGSWSQCRVSGGNDREPSLALDGAMVHVAFARRDGGQQGIHTASGFPPGGGGSCGWDVVKRHSGGDSGPSLGVHGGTLHIAFRTSDKRLRYLRGPWDSHPWSVLETIDGSCCTSRPALALTSTGSPRVAYGDGSGRDADGLRYAVRGSSWKKRRVQGGRVIHTAMVLDYTPDPWNGNQPSNSPSIAYVVKNAGTYRARKSGAGITGAWGVTFFGRHFAPPDLATQSNKSVIIYGHGGRLWATSESGAIFVERKISGSRKDGLPQIALFGVDAVVTFSRERTGEGVYRTSGYL